eukprot:TRINITY_DN8012_c0_g1_i1.p1 TRINITY_DN8012_c0_g1~~TRINITY_DN8012_c0_g1_i1.p1  ORF type:complete len:180 (-),score=33.16 TRINITY_DN8012_c0_g1_i1:142-627(-)
MVASFNRLQSFVSPVPEETILDLKLHWNCEEAHQYFSLLTREQRAIYYEVTQNHDILWPILASLFSISCLRLLTPEAPGWILVSLVALGADLLEGHYVRCMLTHINNTVESTGFPSEVCSALTSSSTTIKWGAVAVEFSVILFYFVKYLCGGPRTGPLKKE